MENELNVKLTVDTDECMKKLKELKKLLLEIQELGVEVSIKIN